MLPQVSVVVPCRDASSWLPACLASLRSQQGVALELLLVDDGSRDGSPAVAERAWEDCPWPMHLLQAEGQGVSVARNLGWRAARYPLVAFLDADDLALPGRLQHQAAMFAADPDLQQVLCGWQRIDAQGRALAAVRPWEEGAGFSSREALRHKAVLPSAWMLRRGALEAAGGFDPALHQAEDVDLLLRLARSGQSGAWLPEVLCGYRVHDDAASRRARPQARGLSLVVERHLRQLSASADDQRLAAEVRYGTRAWLGWYAWTCGDHPLALELWSTALGLSPFMPALTWVHLAENAVRSAARIGTPAELDKLLGSPLWERLQERWWQGRRQPRLESAPSPACGETLDWTAVQRGQVGAALQCWSGQLRAQLQLVNGAEPQGPWQPSALEAWCLGQGPLGTLRLAVLRWSEQLLRLTAEPTCAQASAALDQLSTLERLQADLAVILLDWGLLSWAEDRRPAEQRLEQSIAVLPTAKALIALARLQSPINPAGSRALVLLAAGAPAERAEAPPTTPPPPAFWEDSATTPDSCRGPQCPPCLEQQLRPWSSIALDHGLVHWLPPTDTAERRVPKQTPRPTTGEVGDDKGERQLAVLERGQAWLRPPLRNAWRSTHAFSIADHHDHPLPEFSRRYPQPWSGVCPCPQPSPEPPPPLLPLQLSGTVIALLGLSAETYYHWLLEVLPGLGWLQRHHPHLLGREVRIWHNGGTTAYVEETLQHCFGIGPERLLDARTLPRIQAERLVAVSPLPFGSPSAAAQAWLRRALLPQAQLNPTAPSTAIWLRRGSSARRPVFGEDDVLELLAPLGVKAVDSGRLPVAEQAALVAEAGLVISPHGGAMANLVFASPSATVLELHHPDYRPPYYQKLVPARGFRYMSQAQSARPPALYRDLLFESPATEPIVLDPLRVVAAIRSLL
jgi:hypothetical protein